MEEKDKIYLELFKANYNGISEEAKSLEDFIKTNYKDNSYIPWATMERLARMQDSNLVVQPVLTTEGGLIHTDIITLKQAQEDVNGDNIIKKITESTNYSHTIWLMCEFMDRKFTEFFPIQDNSYEAVRFPNQNEVNKAIQRGKARLLSRATGLGLKLYEQKDLQFDNKDDKPENPIVTKTKKGVISPAPVIKSEETDIVVKEMMNTSGIASINSISPTTQGFKDNIIDKFSKEQVLNVLKKLNTALINAYKVSITEEDLTDLQSLDTKLSKVPNAEELQKSIIKRITEDKGVK